jgi:hypothetical protein
MADPTEVIKDAQRAAGNVLASGLPGDMTAVVVIVPIFARALLDPASDWRAEAIDAARRQIEATRPPISRIHVLSRPGHD